jgi:hypothetical protein
MANLLHNVEFLNHNSQRRYPLADDADGTDESGSFSIPNNFIVELDLPIHAGMNADPARFFVRHIGAFESGFSVVVAYQPATGDPVTVATALIARQTHVRNRAYVLGGVSPYDDTVGKILIGRLESIDEQPAGFWTFALSSTRLDPDAVRPIIRGVASLICVNGTSRSVPMRGHVELISGNNIRLTPVLTDGQNAIRIDAITGEGLIADCVCEGDAAPGEPIRTINGVGPDANGNINLVSGECTQTASVANGVQISDVCSRPCCGCPELEAITRDLERFAAEKETAQAFVDQLREAATTMDTIVLGSILGDRSCVTCD